MPNIGLSDDKVLIAFVDKMVVDKDPAIDDKTRMARRYALKNILDERIQKATIMALPDSYMVGLERLLDMEASDEAIEQLFRESGADFTTAINREMKAFREAYLRGEIEVDITDILAKMPGEVTMMDRAVWPEAPSDSLANTMTTDTNINNVNTQQQAQAPVAPVMPMAAGEER